MDEWGGQGKQGRRELERERESRVKGGREEKRDEKRMLQYRGRGTRMDGWMDEEETENRERKRRD